MNMLGGLVFHQRVMNCLLDLLSLKYILLTFYEHTNMARTWGDKTSSTSDKSMTMNIILSYEIVYLLSKTAGNNPITALDH